MLNDVMILVLLSATAACFSFFLDYTLGKPMSDQVSTKAIFFGYSLWLAKKRLPQKKYQEIVASFAPLLNSDDPIQSAHGKDLMDQTIMIEARKLFFYEQAIGMCPFCTNFWICMVICLVTLFTVPLHAVAALIMFLFVPSLSHTILRKL